MKGSVLSLVPIVYVTDMDRSVAFYEKIGCEILNFSPYWTEMRINGSKLALHIEDELPKQTRVGISMATAAPLEDLISEFDEIANNLREDITKQPFGRSIIITDPDGLPIQINEHH